MQKNSVTQHRRFSQLVDIHGSQRGLPPLKKGDTIHLPPHGCHVDICRNARLLPLAILGKGLIIGPHHH